MSNYDYAQVNEALWKFFYDIYGGGPEVKLKSAPNLSNGQSFNNVSNSILKSPVPMESPVLNHFADQNGDTNCAEGPQAKSLSHVDLFSMEQVNDNGYGKLSVKGTQSLQDVSVRQNVNNAPYKEMENQTMLVETSDGVIEYTLKSMPLTNGSESDYNLKSNSKGNIDSDHTTKKKKGKTLKKTTQNNNSTQKESIAETFHKKNIEDVHNSNHSQDNAEMDNVEDGQNEPLSSDADLPNMEAISLKPKAELSPSVHQRAAKPNKNRKLSGKKQRRQQTGGKRNTPGKSEESTPLVNGGEKITKWFLIAVSFVQRLTKAAAAKTKNVCRKWQDIRIF